MRVFLRHVVDGSVLLLVYTILANFTVITILCGLFLIRTILCGIFLWDAIGMFWLGVCFDHVSRLMFSVRLRVCRVHGARSFRSNFLLLLEGGRRSQRFDFSH